MTLEQIREIIVNDDLDLHDSVSLIWDNGYGDDISSWDMLKDFIKECLDDDDMNMVVHIANAIWNDKGSGDEYWVYDYSMGTLESPYSLGSVDDVLDYIDERI